ncbi:Gfo/Idh/MocA family protein [Variovorax sp. PBL-E5]|uniref:Gfo/Idh/MocA family protein n=1 Tax=Variovorax sp. PBL-E5 TaxID=434014 RepID=UPI001317FF6C|nr:Gfo/Idh/MocA family oxidoreductase [Variovorax sp. PBL-E5]VTU23918.1 1,5-anhydro-D-fructose reductase [Variovorax sp. PBL-E5]
MSQKWGILGAGDIAQRNIVPALAQVEGAELVAVMNRRLANAQAFAERNKIAGAYDSLDAFLAHPQLDAVYIASPNGLHAEHTIAAARAGKHVLCDKPMALTEAECERMIEACERHGVKLGVVFQNRYHPAHIQARRQIEAGVLGEIQYASAQLCVGRARGHWKGWRLDPSVAGSGAIVGQAVHPIDILRFLMDSEVVEVQAMTDQQLPDRPVDDMAYALLRFANGAHATVVAGTVVPRSANDVVLYGSGARIVCTSTLGTPAAGARQKLSIEGEGTGMNLDFSSSTSPQRFAAMLDDFGRCIREQREPALSGRNGLQMVKIANAVLESSRHGKAVRLSPTDQGTR